MKNTILNELSSLAKKSLTLCPPPFAGKVARGLFTFLLLCASITGWATQYCHTEINSTNGNGSVFMTCSPTANENEYKILFEGTNSHPLKAINAVSVGINDINGVPGASTLTFDFDAAENGSAVATFTCTSTPNAPYVAYIVFKMSDNSELVLNEFPKDMDWTAVCGASSKQSPELSLNATSKTLEKDDVAETFQIVPTKTAGSGDISYSSNAEGVATVSNTGLVTAVGPGTATITVSVAENEDFAADSKTLTVEVIDWTSIAWLANSNDSYKLYISPAISDTYGGKRIDGGTKLWVGCPSDLFGDCSIEFTHEGAGASFALSNFPRYRNQFTLVCAGTTYTFTVYRKFDGVNLAKGMPTYAGATALPKAEANDGNKESRWASGGGAKHYPQYGDVAEDWWVVDLGAMYKINSIKTLYEGATPKNYSFYTSPNNDSWIEIDSYNAVPHDGKTDADYNEYTYSPGKVGRYVKIFAREAVQTDFAYGISIWEFEVYGQPAENVDVNAPVLASAVVSGTPTASQVQIAVSATDSEGAVTLYRVKDSSKGIDHNCLVDAGIITINDLSEGTNYSFTITALDNIGNQSNAIVVNTSTAADPTMPQVAAPTPPVRSADDVRAIYADAYANILAHPFDKDGFAGMTLYAEKNIGGNNCLIYDRSGSAPVFTTWGMYDDGANAIIAAAGYSDPDDASHKGVYATSMEYMHIDIWSLQACNTILIRINDGGRTGDLRLSHDGSGWKSFDIPLSEFVAGANINNVRWFKFEAFDAITGKVALDNVYFWKAASGVKSVSAAVNNPLMGTATVKQNDEDVTEVATGSTVTFSATPNDGYVFVNWSNDETRATFDAEVNSNMNLTANFRAQGTVYCNTEVTSTRDDDVHVAYATMKRTSANNYKLVVRSAETLGNFSNTTLQVNGSENLNLNNQGTLTDNNHVLTYEFTSTTPPSMTSGYMYLNVPGSKFTECWFTRLTNIEYEIPCNDDNVPVESISLNYDEATIEIGATKTLVVSFNPVYATDKSITWTSSNGTVASVDGGVVTANTVGTATITAETSNGKTATCAVTVEPVTEKTCWGTGTDFTYDDRTISWYYSVTRNENKTLTYYAEFSSSVAGLGNLDVVIDNDVWKHMTYNASTMSASYTTEGTYETGAVLNDFFYFEGRRQDFSYTVGSECAKPTVDVTGVGINHTSAELLVGETLTLSAEVVPANADDKVIIWENSDETVASFNTSTGEITALAEGTTTITAKSHFDEDIYATCVVTVSSAITAKTWYGVATFTPNEGLTGFTYSITRNTDRSLTFSVVLDKNPVGFVGEVCISGSYKGMSYSASTLTATYTTDANYAADGDALNAYWWLKSADNADGVDFTYTVGSENDPLPQAVAVDETKDNNAILTTYDDQTVIGVLGRSFEAHNLYTLVLPFDVDAAQMAAKLPGKLTKLGGVRKKANDDMYLNFVNVSSMQAGVAYLYTPSENVTNPVFENVVVKKDLVSSSYTQDGYTATYTGIYDAIDVQANITGTDKYVLGSDQWLYNVSEMPQTMTMNAFRGYFTLNFGANAAPGRRARVVFGDIDDNPMATELEELDNKQLPDKRIENGQLLIIRNGHTYNAQGQLLR